MAINIKPFLPLDHPHVTQPDTGLSMINESNKDDVPVYDFKKYPKGEEPQDLLEREKEIKKKNQDKKKLDIL